MDEISDNQEEKSEVVMKKKKGIPKWLRVIIWIIVIAIGAIIIYYISASSYYAVQRNRCESNGGAYTTVCSRQFYRCLEVYSDGGESCTNSDQCEGSCEVTGFNAETLEEADPRCTSNNDYCGCAQSIESFIAGERSALCID